MNIINKKIVLPKPYYESEHIGNSPLEHYAKKWNDKERETLSINFLEKDSSMIEKDWATIVSSFERIFEGFVDFFFSREYVVFTKAKTYNGEQRLGEIWMFPVLSEDKISGYLDFSLEEFLDERYNFSYYKSKYLDNQGHQRFFKLKYDYNSLGSNVEYYSGKIPYNKNEKINYDDSSDFCVVPVKTNIKNTNGFIDLIYFIGGSSIQEW